MFFLLQLIKAIFFEDGDGRFYRCNERGDCHGRIWIKASCTDYENVKATDVGKEQQHSCNPSHRLAKAKAAKFEEMLLIIDPELSPATIHGLIFELFPDHAPAQADNDAGQIRKRFARMCDAIRKRIERFHVYCNKREAPRLSHVKLRILRTMLEDLHVDTSQLTETIRTLLVKCNQRLSLPEEEGSNQLAQQNHDNDSLSIPRRGW